MDGGGAVGDHAGTIRIYPRALIASKRSLHISLTSRTCKAEQRPDEKIHVLFTTSGLMRNYMF